MIAASHSPLRAWDAAARRSSAAERVSASPKSVTWLARARRELRGTPHTMKAATITITTTMAAMRANAEPHPPSSSVSNRRSKNSAIARAMRSIGVGSAAW